MRVLGYHPSNREYITWATLVGKYMNRHSPLIADNSRGEFDTVFPLAAQCPEADQWRKHVVSYAINMVVGVSPWHEFNFTLEGHRGSLTRPTRLNQLLKETAVLWDTGIFEEWLMRPDLRLGADIDAQRVRLGALVPQYRFYTVKDIFAEFPPGIHGQNHPIQLNVPPKTFYNRDPGTIAAEGTQYPYQGNLRFRHQKNTTCNVAFADGSVRQFTAKMNPNKTVKSHDALRRYFMIKWPSGVQAHPDYPH